MGGREKKGRGGRKQYTVGGKLPASEWVRRETQRGAEKWVEKSRNTEEGGKNMCKESTRKKELKILLQLQVFKYVQELCTDVFANISTQC